jgi:hypothetical protein
VPRFPLGRRGSTGCRDELKWSSGFVGATWHDDPSPNTGSQAGPLRTIGVECLVERTRRAPETRSATRKSRQNARRRRRSRHLPVSGGGSAGSNPELRHCRGHCRGHRPLSSGFFLPHRNHLGAWHVSWHECVLASCHASPDAPDPRFHRATPQRLVPRHGLRRHGPVDGEEVVGQVAAQPVERHRCGDSFHRSANSAIRDQRRGVEVGPLDASVAEERADGRAEPLSPQRASLTNFDETRERGLSPRAAVTQRRRATTQSCVIATTE